MGESSRTLNSRDADKIWPTDEPERLRSRDKCGIETARPTARVTAAIEAADVVVIGPSNPIVSIGPILAIPGMRELLVEARGRGTSIVAVSGIVGGVALKGPADWRTMLTRWILEGRESGWIKQHMLEAA